MTHVAHYRPQLGATPVLEQGGSGGVQEACAQLAAQVRENIALRRGYAMVAGAHG
jgi:translation elongation factor EF-Ts